MIVGERRQLGFAFECGADGLECDDAVGGSVQVVANA
jgi:hypothetical protein